MNKDVRLNEILAVLRTWLIKEHDPMHNNMLRDARKDLVEAIERFRKCNIPEGKY